MNFIIEMNLKNWTVKVFCRKPKEMRVFENVSGVNVLEDKGILVLYFRNGEKHYFDGTLRLIGKTALNGNQIVSIMS